VPPRRHYCRECDDACAYFNSKWKVKKPLARHAQAGAMRAVKAYLKRSKLCHPLFLTTGEALCSDSVGEAPDRTTCRTRA
jgi:hypothetical protein